MKPFIPQKLPLENLAWEKFIPLIGKANAEVARFDGLLQNMPNPAVLLSLLTTQEAVLSSKIEGTQATLKDVLKFEANPDPKSEKYHDIQEILNYRKAMKTAIKELAKKPLCLNLIKKIHAVLLGGVRGQNKDCGNFRKIQVWIGKPGAQIENASFIPPTPNLLLGFLSNLEKYIHTNEKDPLVQLAIIHAQFEIIHPFLDGNGRVGRILLPLFMFEKRLLSSPMLYLSAYLESHREEYYQKLKNISQNNNWQEWIVYFLSAIIEQSKTNIQKAKKIHELYDQKKDKIVSLTHSRFAIKTLDFIFSYPIFNSSQFIKQSRIPSRSAINILKQLKNGGVIYVAKKGSGRKPNTYHFTKLLKIVG